MSSTSEPEAKKCKVDSNDATREWNCSYCDLSFVSRNLLFKHIRNVGTSCAVKASDDGLKAVQKKQRVALILAFIGTPFAGMQDQVDRTDTIEVSKTK